MDSKGIVASTAALSVLLQEGIGDTIRVSLTPEPGGARTREVQVAQEILQSLGLRAFVADGDGLPRVRPHHQAPCSRSWPRACRRICASGCPNGRAAFPGREPDRCGDGLRGQRAWREPARRYRNQPAGDGEQPVAPVFIDGERRITLKGERISEEFEAIVEEYVTVVTAHPASCPESELDEPPNQDSGFLTASAITLASPKIAAVRGMNDLLPAQAPLWEAFGRRRYGPCRSYGYAQIRTPILEATACSGAGSRGDRHRRKRDVTASSTR